MASASWRRCGERQVADDRGHVARVHVAQAGGLGRHLAVAANRLGHLVPVDDAVRRAPAQRAAARQAHLRDLPRRSSVPVGLAEGDVADGLVADAACR